MIEKRIVLFAAMAISLGCQSNRKPPASAPAPALATHSGSNAMAAPDNAATSKPSDEFDEAARVLNLQGEQKDHFDAAHAERDRKFDAWDKTDQADAIRKVTAERDEAKKAKDQAKIDQISADLDLMKKAAFAFRSNLRAEVWAVLTPDEQRQWTTHILAGRVLHSVEKSTPTDDQKARIIALCDDAVRVWIRPNTLQVDPYLLTVRDLQPAIVETVKSQVLNDQQRSRFSPSTKSTTKPAAKPGSDSN